MKKILHLIGQRTDKTGSATYLKAMVQEGDKKGYNQAVVAAVSMDDLHINSNNTKQIIEYNTSQIFEIGKEKLESTFNMSNIKNKVEFYPVIFQTEELPMPVVGMTDIMPYESFKYSNLTDELYLKWREAFKKILYKAVDEFRPDYIISNHLWIVSAMAKELFPNIPMMVICHGTDLMQMKLAPKFAPYVKKHLKNIECIGALHEDQKQEIMKIYEIPEHKIQIVGVGYNPKVFNPSCEVKDLNKIKLIYAGKLNFAKGVPYLVNSYNKLNLQQLGLNKDSIELVLAGAGKGIEEEIIKHMAEKSELKVTLKGAIPQSELAQLFKEGHIFVFPSFYEGLPLVLIEAIASGLRVVTTDLPGVKTFMGDYINHKNIIEYVHMPRLKTIDKPYEEEIDFFQELFQQAIEKQILRVKEENHKSNIEFIKAIECKQWSGVFSKIEDCIKSF